MKDRNSDYRPCACGCGTPARGEYKHGHRPIKSYRSVGTTRLHIVRAERALGKALPPDAIVHHADGSKDDDAPLVICQDQDYHVLLHRRMRIVESGGNPNTDAVCKHCGPKPVGDFYTTTFKRGERTYSYPQNVCRLCSLRESKNAYDRRKSEAAA